MSSIYVKSGNGLVFELLLPRGEKLQELVRTLEEIFRGPEENVTRKIIDTTKELFPVICREALEKITDADARKLGESILAGLKEERMENFSGEIIQAAFYYKWTLEYAASLPFKVLLRCLEVAEGKNSVPAAVPPEELRKAAARGMEAARKFLEKH